MHVCIYIYIYIEREREPIALLQVDLVVGAGGRADLLGEGGQFVVVIVRIRPIFKLRIYNFGV